MSSVEARGHLRSAKRLSATLFSPSLARKLTSRGFVKHLIEKDTDQILGVSTTEAAGELGT